ncbi:MAG: phospholipase [Gemmatimonadota bacterium]
MDEHHLTVQRTARYATLGPRGPAAHEVWFLCHGYGQRAASFLEGFSALDDGHRLLVAPEALSRFYLESGPSGRHGEQVGASWMTREERDEEIDDYVRYLEALRGHVLAPIGRTDVPVRVFGFSQGVATAARWIARTNWRPAELVLWGGLVPGELLGADQDLLRPEIPVVLVAGDRDDTLDPLKLKAQAAELRTRGIRCQEIGFAGGHRLHSDTLLRLANRPPAGPA